MKPMRVLLSQSAPCLHAFNGGSRSNYQIMKDMVYPASKNGETARNGHPNQTHPHRGRILCSVAEEELEKENVPYRVEEIVVDTVLKGKQPLKVLY